MALPYPYDERESALSQVPERSQSSKSSAQSKTGTPIMMAPTACEVADLPYPLDEHESAVSESAGTKRISRNRITTG